MDFPKAEDKVRNFYDQKGWNVNADGSTKDAELWEDLRPVAKNYVVACRRKLLKFLPRSGDLFLDAASGPVQYPEYLEYSAGFKKRVCVDISQAALTSAKEKLGDHAETVLSSVTKLPMADNAFDAVVSLHTIYHIDESEQEKAVRELLRVAKPGAPVVIVYSNPNRLLARVKRYLKPAGTRATEGDHLYFHAFPLKWWSRFEDDALVEKHSWRFLTASDAQKFIPAGFLGKTIFSLFLTIESALPSFAVNFGAYPLIVLKKIK